VIIHKSANQQIQLITRVISELIFLKDPPHLKEDLK